MSKHTPKRYRPEDQKPKSRKKLAIILASLCLACAIGVGSTVAFITTSTETVENTFVPTDVTCEIRETVDASTKTKSDVYVENTGEIPAYIRAEVVINWMDGNGNVLGIPVDNTNNSVYELADPESGWILGNDGYYYYTSAVAPNGKTTELIPSCTLKSDAVPTDAEGNRYQLSVEIIASAIQAEPDTVIETAWDNEKITINADDGSLTIEAE